MRWIFLWVLLLSSALAELPVLNQYVLQAVRQMPKGKGYEASQRAVDRLAGAVKVNDGGRFSIDYRKVGSCFCSGATYLVMLQVMNDLEMAGAPRFSRKAKERWARLGVADGEAVFGRWNANGPGTARLFHELKCGKNFTGFERALPGDFLKIWWTEEIGGRERGHLVVYLGTERGKVRFWSANQPKGYGEKAVPRERIKRHLFSRLTDYRHLERVTGLSEKDDFLAEMLRKSFVWKEMVQKCGVK